jgi:hypothetical protein
MARSNTEVIGRRSIIISFFPSPFLTPGTNNDEVVSIATVVRNSKELDKKLQMLSGVQGPRSYLAEFIGFRPEDGAPQWKPLLRLNLTEMDGYEAFDAPNAATVHQWISGDLEAIDVDVREPLGPVR